MLPFGHQAFIVIKCFLNFEKYIEHGSELFVETRKHVLLNTEIPSVFNTCVKSLYEPGSDETEDSIANRALLSKILNTINDDFLAHITQLDKTKVQEQISYYVTGQKQQLQTLTPEYQRSINCMYIKTAYGHISTYL